MIIIIIVTLITIGISYAIFTYSKTGDVQQLVVGNVYMKFKEGKDSINLTNMFPETAEDARKRDDNTITFTIEGLNTTTDKDIYYEIKLLYGDNFEGKTRFKDKELKFDLIEKVGDESKLVLDAVNYNTINDTKIWVNTINRDSETEISYQLRMWISDDVTVSDTSQQASYTTSEYINKYASVKIGVYGDFQEKKIFPQLYDVLETNLASNLLEDDGDARIVSGSSDINNYVWYSGKLWRIIALNNDGSIKLVTENNMTNISWGSSTTYFNKETKTGSYIYQWLNEDFLDTLVNSENMVMTDYKWNVTQTSATTKPSNDILVEAPVGLLSAYEYTASYSKASSNAQGYLNNGYYWWLSTPVSQTNVRAVYYNGTLNSRNSTTNAAGVRPSINLAAGVRLNGDGDGSIDRPYRLEGDIKAPTTNATMLNKRINGEYLYFDKELYRIVSIENGITKIVKADYLKDATTPVNKKFASTISYGSTDSSTCGEECDNYWDQYLNNSWKSRLDDDYKKMLVEGVWYLGIYPNGVSYKNTICEESNTLQTIEKCKKTTSIFRGAIGLGRVGEIFTSQVGGGYNNSTNLWTITPFDDTRVLRVNNDGRLIYSNPSSDSHAIRPSMYLSSNVFITDGDGTKNNAFKISI